MFKFTKYFLWFFQALFHSAQIMRTLPFSLGAMGEGSVEARNKDIRDILANNVRTDKRIHSIEDLLNALLVRSDPVIIKVQAPFRKCKTMFDTYNKEGNTEEQKNLTREVNNLLKE